MPAKRVGERIVSAKAVACQIDRAPLAPIAPARTRKRGKARLHDAEGRSPSEGRYGRVLRIEIGIMGSSGGIRPLFSGSGCESSCLPAGGHAQAQPSQRRDRLLQIKK